MVYKRLTYGVVDTMKAKEVSKKDATIEKVRLVLDNPLQCTLQRHDERYLKTLQDRLLGLSLPGIRQRYAGSISHYGSLQPYVTIHKREEPARQQLPEFKEIPSKDIPIGGKTPDLFGDEELFEVERVEYDVPEFIEVKPQQVEKKEEAAVEFKVVSETSLEEKPTSSVKSPEEELPEFIEEPQLPQWEPVEKPVSKEEPQEPQPSEPELIPIPKEEEPEKTQQPEPVQDEVPLQKKLVVFKGLNSVNEKLAVLLYDHGFTSLESLKQASLKELRAIDGVTRKHANAIKREIEKEPKWETIEERNGEETIKSTKVSVSTPDGWEPVEEESLVEPTKQPVEIPEEEISSPVEVFKEIPSIDHRIAQLLINHGITSIELLQQTTIKGLTRIRGIKRGVAKQIKQDLQNLKSTDKNTVNTKTSKEPVMWEEIDDEQDDIVRSGSNEEQGYRQGEFLLYKKEVTLTPGTTRTIHFFSKEPPEEGTPTTLPDGFEVDVNKRTGVPYIRKKR